MNKCFKEVSVKQCCCVEFILLMGIKMVKVAVIEEGPSPFALVFELLQPIDLFQFLNSHTRQKQARFTNDGRNHVAQFGEDEIKETININARGDLNFVHELVSLEPNVEQRLRRSNSDCGRKR